MATQDTVSQFKAGKFNFTGSLTFSGPSIAAFESSTFHYKIHRWKRNNSTNKSSQQIWDWRSCDFGEMVLSSTVTGGSTLAMKTGVSSQKIYAGTYIMNG